MDTDRMERSRRVTLTITFVAIFLSFTLGVHLLTLLAGVGVAVSAAVFTVERGRAMRAAYERTARS